MLHDSLFSSVQEIFRILKFGHMLEEPTRLFGKSHILFYYDHSSLPEFGIRFQSPEFLLPSSPSSYPEDSRLENGFFEKIPGFHR
jgi:hypothetical protein